MKEFILKMLLLALAPSALLMFNHSASRSNMYCQYNAECPPGMLCVYEDEDSAVGICIIADEVPDDAIIGWNPGQGGGGSTGGADRDQCKVNAECPQGFVCISNGKYLDCLPPK